MRVQSQGGTHSEDFKDDSTSNDPDETNKKQKAHNSKNDKDKKDAKNEDYYKIGGDAPAQNEALSQTNNEQSTGRYGNLKETNQDSEQQTSSPSAKASKTKKNGRKRTQKGAKQRAARAARAAQKVSNKPSKSHGKKSSGAKSRHRVQRKKR